MSWRCKYQTKHIGNEACDCGHYDTDDHIVTATAPDGSTEYWAWILEADDNAWTSDKAEATRIDRETAERIRDEARAEFEDRGELRVEAVHVGVEPIIQALTVMNLDGDEGITTFTNGNMAYWGPGPGVEVWIVNPKGERWIEWEDGPHARAMDNGPAENNRVWTADEAAEHDRVYRGE